MEKTEGSDNLLRRSKVKQFSKIIRIKEFAIELYFALTEKEWYLARID